MLVMTSSGRLYDDLAWLWPLWGEVEEYRAESDAIAALMQRYAEIEVRTLLDVACGGGKNLYHFRRHFEASGLDLSEAMLDSARRLNPDCRLHHGDMRSFDLAEHFDAIYLNDGLPHLTSREDLARTFARGHAHLNPGGVLMAVAEFTTERWVQNQTSVFTAPPCPEQQVEVTFIENHYDPDPRDDTSEATILYLIREQGRLRIERDDWVFGLFPLTFWVEALTAAGFQVDVEEGIEALENLPLLVGRKR
jgi:SAM-dependent methyltransferase